MTIKKIIKNTLEELKRKNLVATPDNYYSEFTFQSKLLNEKVEECEIFNNIVNSLTKDEQKQIQNNNIITFSSLASFLVNRTSLENIKDLANSLNEILTSSITSNVDNDAKQLSDNLFENPYELLDKKTIKKIKDLTKSRIENDRKIVRNKTEDIVKLTSLMGKYFDKTLLESGTSHDKISNIKIELETLNISSISQRELGILQGKLVGTMYEIEHSMEKNKLELIKNKSAFIKLQKNIKKLEEELKSAKDEYELDSLTNVYSRLSFDKEIMKIEKKHKIFNSNYAIVFYSIDEFNSICSSYTNDCGDALLRTFSAILKSLTRQEDIVARYTHDEFAVLLNYSDENELLQYINRVKSIIENNNFNYKNDIITVHFSAGLSRRDKNTTEQETLLMSKKLLDKAKKIEKNTIFLDNDIRI